MLGSYTNRIAAEMVLLYGVEGAYDGSSHLRAPSVAYLGSAGLTKTSCGAATGEARSKRTASTPLATRRPSAPVMARVRSAMGLHQRLVDQACEQTRDLSLLRRGQGTYRLGRLQRPAADEHRQLPEHRTLPFGQELVAPLDRSPQRLLPGRARARASEQFHAAGQPGSDLLQVQRPGPRSREFQGQRNAVQMKADRRHRRNITWADHQAGPGGPRPRQEQGGRLEALQVPLGRHALRPGERQRGHAPGHLARYSQRLSAGRQHHHVRARAEQRHHELRERSPQMLAVVHYQQPVLTMQHPQQRVPHVGASPLLHSQVGSQRRDTEAGMAKLVAISGTRR